MYFELLQNTMVTVLLEYVDMFDIIIMVTIAIGSPMIVKL